MPRSISAAKFSTAAVADAPGKAAQEVISKADTT
jgi:hypothetical protein